MAQTRTASHEELGRRDFVFRRTCTRFSLSTEAEPKPSPGAPYQYSVVSMPKGLAPLVLPGIRAINDAGNIVGYTTSNADGASHGFLLRHDFYLRLDVPGAIGEAWSDGTIKPGSTPRMGINDRDDIVGYFTYRQGFLLRLDVYTTLSLPKTNWGAVAVGISGPGYARYTHYFFWDHEICTITKPFNESDYVSHVDGINN